jgi:hypothetical protein
VTIVHGNVLTHIPVRLELTNPLAILQLQFGAAANLRLVCNASWVTGDVLP